MNPHIEFTAKVARGVFGSTAILELDEKWIANGEKSDWIYHDIDECSAGDWLECLDGFDHQRGVFTVSGKATCGGDECIDEYNEVTFTPAD